jgi:hypothetical protein
VNRTRILRSTEFISRGSTYVISQNETIQPQILEDIKKKRKNWEETLCRKIKETETMLWTGELKATLAHPHLTFYVTTYYLFIFL